MRPEQLIVALDGTVKDCIKFVYETEDLGIMYKIGLPLFVQGGYPILREFISDDRIFLDLKLDDIPETIIRTVTVLPGKPKFITVQGGADTVRAARTIWPFPIAYVPVLSSRVVCLQDFRTELREAHKAGADAIVASGWLVAIVKNFYPEMTIISPGIRFSTDGGFSYKDTHEHKRYLTPKLALTMGADHIVVGRPILRSENKKATIEEILQ